jgi:hypothetical protein
MTVSFVVVTALAHVHNTKEESWVKLRI